MQEQLLSINNSIKNMKPSKNLLMITLSLTFFLFSCKKEEGEGGKASIYGSIWVKKYNVTGLVTLGEYAGAYEDVYIVYGDDATYGNRIETGPEGKFEFKYLRPGNYKIYAYSRDSLGNDTVPKFAVIKDVVISKKKESVDAGTFKIFTYQE
jgi:hypothetical protein